MTPEEAKSKYPNVWRVAQELARCEHPEKVLSALYSMLSPENQQKFDAKVNELLKEQEADA